MTVKNNLLQFQPHFDGYVKYLAATSSCFLLDGARFGALGVAVWVSRLRCHPHNNFFLQLRHGDGASSGVMECVRPCTWGSHNAPILPPFDDVGVGGEDLGAGGSSTWCCFLVLVWRYRSRKLCDNGDPICRYNVHDNSEWEWQWQRYSGPLQIQSSWRLQVGVSVTGHHGGSRVELYPMDLGVVFYLLVRCCVPLVLLIDLGSCKKNTIFNKLHCL
jgi:hypothetical protein